MNIKEIEQRVAEACAALARQWGDARKAQYGGNALRNFAEAVDEGKWKEFEK